MGSCGLIFAITLGPLALIFGDTSFTFGNNLTVGGKAGVKEKPLHQYLRVFLFERESGERTRTQ